MFAIDDATAVAALPTPEAAGTPGYWTEGNPGTGVPATYVRASFLNMLQQELLNVVTGAGLTPSKTTYNQLLLALNTRAPTVGQTRNLRATQTAAGTSLTFTADEVVVKSALGGIATILPNFNKTLNVATTGAGAMDTGLAPISGWVAAYAIVNLTTGVSNVLGVDATAAVAPEVYGGAFMPLGYSCAGLISVWPTNASRQLAVARQFGRDIEYFNNPYNGAGNASFTSLSISAAVPRNAYKWKGNLSFAPTATGNISMAVCPTAAGIGTPGYRGFALYSGTGINVGGSLSDVPIVTAQTTFYVTAGAGNFTINSYGYTF